MTSPEGVAVRRGAAAHLFVADLDAPRAEAGDHEHLARSLRLRPGEVVTVTDGSGRWRTTAWTGDSLEVTGEIHVETAPAPPLAVGFVVTKGDRPERVVRAATELGVEELILLASRRSVVQWTGDRGERHRARLARVAREAAMQSRLVHLPRVRPVTPVAEVVGPGVVLAEPGGSAVSLAAPTVLVGPEGGWAPEERELAPAVSLGPTILRAETAAVAAAVLLTNLRWSAAAPPG